MARFLKKRHASSGLSPGSLIFIGKQKVDNYRVRLIDYDKSKLIEDELRDIHQGRKCLKTDTVSWINIDGLHDTEIMNQIGSVFKIHALVLEDILNTGHRPKLEDNDDYLFIILKMLSYDEEKQLINSEQLSMIIGKTCLLTFQEQPGDVFEPVRMRIRKGKGRIRVGGVDYLAYALLDMVVDNYMHIIERLGEQIEDLGEIVLTNPERSLMEKIGNLKRELNFLRKSIRPFREAIVQLIKLDSDIIQDGSRLFLKDLLDHLTETVESMDMYQVLLSDQLNMYNSAVSNKTNDIMRVLTIFAAIFIPLTFIAGVYGTNFDYLPELHFKYAYFIFLGVLAAVGISMVLFFRKKGWV